MRIHLAGIESVSNIARIGRIKYGLLSYYHIKQNSRVVDDLNDAGIEVICDSGIFSMMFGAGKGKTYDLQYMVEYTKRYI